MPQYSNKMMELFTNPKNVGSLDDENPNVGTGVSGSIACCFANKQVLCT